MAGKRNYDDPCGVARALDLIGERWALLVVRELLLGPKRFSDLARGLPAISQNVLSQRLRELEQAGVVRRVRLGPPASAAGYQLTDRGAGLDQVLLALARWGSRLPLESAADLSVDALALALRTTFDPDAAADLHAVLALRIGDDQLRADIDSGRFQISRSSAPDAAATVTAGVITLRSLVFRGLPLTTALASGDAQVTGDLAAAERFLRSFPRPGSATRA